MLDKFLRNLTRDQKAELRRGGIGDNLRSQWLADFVKPTMAELLMLAEVANVPVTVLVIEIAERTVKPRQRELFDKALGKLKERGAAATLLGFGASAVALLVAVGDQAQCILC